MGWSTRMHELNHSNMAVPLCKTEISKLLILYSFLRLALWDEYGSCTISRTARSVCNELYLFLSFSVMAVTLRREGAEAAACTWMCTTCNLMCFVYSSSEGVWRRLCLTKDVFSWLSSSNSCLNAYCPIDFLWHSFSRLDGWMSAAQSRRWP